MARQSRGRDLARWSSRRVPTRLVRGVLGRARGRRSDSERGAGLVEFAILLPVLAMIVFGAFSGAAAYNLKQDVVYIAREGARYGSAVPQDQCTPTSNCGNKTWAQLVQSIVVARSNAGITTSNVCVALVSGSSATVVGSSFTTSGDGSRCFSDSSGDTSTRVQVRVTRATSLEAVLLKQSINIASNATARFETQ